MIEFYYGNVEDLVKWIRKLKLLNKKQETEDLLKKIHGRLNEFKDEKNLKEICVNEKYKWGAACRQEETGFKANDFRIKYFANCKGCPDLEICHLEFDLKDLEEEIIELKEPSERFVENINNSK